MNKKLTFCAIIELYKKKKGGWIMCRINIHFASFVYCLISILLSSCSSMGDGTNSYNEQRMQSSQSSLPADYAARLPEHITTGEKTVLVDPNVHAWGAYDAEGNLVKAGLTTAGANWCPDINRGCKTSAGSFRIQSLGEPECKSKIFPVGKGGAPMPYCMFFNGGQGLHGSYEVVEANVSHGCVRMQVADAEWLRYNFANVGTKVVVRPY
jgi:lipoprotein-anchoring transpeptidase ErfK/SrfK